MEPRGIAKTRGLWSEIASRRTTSYRLHRWTCPCQGLLPTDAELISLIASTWPYAAKYQRCSRFLVAVSRHIPPTIFHDRSSTKIRSLRFVFVLSFCETKTISAKRAYVSAIWTRSRRSDTFLRFHLNVIDSESETKSRWSVYGERASISLESKSAGERFRRN